VAEPADARDLGSHHPKTRESSNRQYLLAFSRFLASAVSVVFVAENYLGSRRYGTSDGTGRRAVCADSLARSVSARLPHCGSGDCCQDLSAIPVQAVREAKDARRSPGSLSFQDLDARGRPRYGVCFEPSKA
jgi:hypothetical protein